MQTIVISAVNIVDGGAYSVLTSCLKTLTVFHEKGYKIIAIVHDRKIMPSLNGVEYISYPKAKRRYIYRLWCEYFYFKKLSKKLRPQLWLSLHDISPKVKTGVQAVYMHNPTPFYTPSRLDWRFVPINAVWAYLYKYIYQINIHANRYLIVQQNWLREEFSRMFSFPKDRIIVARPITRAIEVNNTGSISNRDSYTFVYPAYPRVFKNFEVICEAVKILRDMGISNLRVRLTVNGTENKYSKYLVDKYSDIQSIEFCGLIPSGDMETFYSDSDCLIFPSKLETWGLPLSEYQPYHKPMIVADLPYAHESVAGAEKVCFFNPNSAEELAAAMKNAIDGIYTNFSQVAELKIDAPTTKSWEKLFNLLLEDEKDS